MSEVVVPLLDLPALGKTPPGKLPSKADFSSFQFAGVNLANVNLEALAKVARRAVKIDLCNAALTADQANALVIALAEIMIRSRKLTCRITP